MHRGENAKSDATKKANKFAEIISNRMNCAIMIIIMIIIKGSDLLTSTRAALIRAQLKLVSPSTGRSALRSAAGDCSGSSRPRTAKRQERGKNSINMMHFQDALTPPSSSCGVRRQLKGCR